MKKIKKRNSDKHNHKKTIVPYKLLISKFFNTITLSYICIFVTVKLYYKRKVTIWAITFS